MVKKQVMIFIIIFFSLFILFNSIIIKTLNKKQLNTRPFTAEQSTIMQKSKQDIPSGRRSKGVTEDPAKYGIISISKHELPKEQAEWDFYLEKILKKSHVLDTEEANLALEKMQTTPEYFQETIGRVEDRIILFEQNVKENPDDMEAQKRLQNLYMLKSLGKVLEEKVVTEDPVITEDPKGNPINPTTHSPPKNTR